MAKISVLIPIYNVEKYIERCARSLFDQTLQDIEYIFVNDCTPDNSINILNEVIKDFPAKRHQITILQHSENRGLAAARNTGVSAASGDYIIHCDSDDWVEPEIYEEMYMKAVENNSDIVLCDFVREKHSYSKICKQYYCSIPHEHVKFILNHKVPVFCWNILVKRSLYIENNLKWIEGIDMWEDLLMATKLFFFAKKLSYIDKPFYHYERRNLSSIATCISSNSLNQMVQAVQEIESFYKKQGAYQEFKNDINNLKIHIKYRHLKNGDDSVCINAITLFSDLDCRIFSSSLEKRRKIKLWLAVKCPFLFPLLRRI